MPTPPKSAADSIVPDEQITLEDLDSSNGQSRSFDATKSTFEMAAQRQAPHVIVEFFDFLRGNKKWWLTPIILILIVFSFFIALTSSAVGPFIYVLF